MTPEQRARTLALLGIRRFDPGQPRDPHTGEWIDVPGVGEIAHKLADAVSADEFGNYREDGRWFDQDRIYMTDSYVERFGLPVTHSGFGGDSTGRYSVVYSESGDIHVMWERDGGPADALFSRDVKDVRTTVTDADGIRSLADDLEFTSDATTVDDSVGETATNEATGLTLTAATGGSVVVGGFGKNGKDVTFTEDEVADFIGAVETIADEADAYGGVAT